MTRSLDMHPDRLFPPEPAVRDIARRLYTEVEGLPIISPHSHVPPELIADDTPFNDPTSLLITPDHYVTRLLHSHGIKLSELGVGTELSPQQSAEAFRLLCSNWDLYRGTPVRYWFHDVLHRVFGVEQLPSAETADAIYDAIVEWIDTDQARPRALLKEFGIAMLATTDDPCDDLEHHAAIAADNDVECRVLPTFRPDRYLEPGRAGWTGLVQRLGEVSGVDCNSYSGWVAAMESRRAFFKKHGAVSTDHSHADLGTERLAEGTAEGFYQQALADSIESWDADQLRRHMIHEMFRMSADDGLTMTLHPAVYRNHHPQSFADFGADVGCDIPLQIEATRSLQPALAHFGTHPNLTVVLFGMDESVYSREYAPLAGFYPSVYVGVPWWFLDAPESIRRFHRAVTETTGFSRLSGFIDDTRAFLSIPARHDMSRRLDASYLAHLVSEHRLDEESALDVARHLIVDQPRKVFKL